MRAVMSPEGAGVNEGYECPRQAYLIADHLAPDMVLRITGSKPYRNGAYLVEHVRIHVREEGPVMLVSFRVVSCRD